MGEVEVEEEVEFKSYYVVWKPYTDDDGIQSYEVFKSYYVVWKQIEEAGVGVSPTPFKSYYVVWKLERYTHSSSNFGV